MCQLQIFSPLIRLFQKSNTAQSYNIFFNRQKPFTVFVGVVASTKKCTFQVKRYTNINENFKYQSYIYLTALKLISRLLMEWVSAPTDI